ncbi:MAG: hypothetical protein AAF170_15710 [Bacteroidota bacterium]
MDKEEFERIKAEEKAHLRKLRELKQTHRDVQRKAKIVNAVRGMRNAELESEIDAQTESFYRDAAHQEARLDLAIDSNALEKAAAAEADKEAIAKQEAAALIAQMKAEMGERPGSPDARPDASPTGAKSIGRTPPPEEDPPPPSADRGAKSIGRQRGS